MSSAFSALSAWVRGRCGRVTRTPRKRLTHVYVYTSKLGYTIHYTYPHAYICSRATACSKGDSRLKLAAGKDLERLSGTGH